MTAFTAGQAVRWSAELAEWYAAPRPRNPRVCVSADPPPPLPPLDRTGRVLTVITDGGSCCQCAGHPWDCPGPWYLIDFPGAGNWSGQYAEHQLQAA